VPRSKSGRPLPGAPKQGLEPLATKAANLRTASRRHYAPPKRVLRVGRLLGRSALVWLRNLVPFTIVSLACGSPIVLFRLATTKPGVGVVEGSLVDLAMSLAEWGFTMLASGAMAYGVVASLRGQPAGLGECLTRGFRRLPTILGTGLFILLYVVGASIVLGIAAALVIGVLGFLGGSVLALFAVAVLQLLPIALVLALFWVAIPAAVVEQLPAGRALQRSKTLTRGNFAPAFWTVVVMLVARAGASIGAVFLAMRGTVERETPFGSFEVAAFDRLVLVLVPLAAQILVIGPVTAVASAISYQELRVANEGVSAAELAKVFE
jgi:hypothetical protein